MAFTSGFMLIGWAKPVPVNRSKLRNLHRDDAIVSVIEVGLVEMIGSGTPIPLKLIG